ncbi:hypothetical protein NA56DRAFT_590873 [Hyaloscypha hepaticicola]|uniref:DNA/RNA-binding protein Alba-like domain-containing protein n=1 Tax=Hyaloscypha hepaticicola TaxID=2082293 RepID=A0A2J6QMG1_9HELO|nr:hypothetical protein NA56DRAFT_590873 [Hyaloscypha hepaticicola]
MARTKATARKGPEGREYRENMKTPEGRKRDQENKKKKHEAKKAAKAAQQQSGSPEPALTNNGEKDKKQNGLEQDKEAEKSMQLDSTIAASGANESSTNANAGSRVLTGLENTHNITTMSIISSSHIQQKVTRALDILSEYPAVPPAKPKVVMLYSKAAVASKMITIAEIVKREIAKAGGKWYQYNKLNKVVEEKVEKAGSAKKEKSTSGNVPMAENGDDGSGKESEEEFETMKTPFERAIEGKPKIRAIPVMTIYLSRVRIDSLRRDHTEQTNGLERLVR